MAFYIDESFTLGGQADDGSEWKMKCRVELDGALLRVDFTAGHAPLTTTFIIDREDMVKFIMHACNRLKIRL